MKKEDRNKVNKELTSVASLFHVINDRIKVLLPLFALRTNEYEREREKI